MKGEIETPPAESSGSVFSPFSRWRELKLEASSRFAENFPSWRPSVPRKYFTFYHQQLYPHKRPTADSPKAFLSGSRASPVKQHVAYHARVGAQKLRILAQRGSLEEAPYIGHHGVAKNSPAAYGEHKGQLLSSYISAVSGENNTLKRVCLFSIVLTVVSFS